MRSDPANLVQTDDERKNKAINTLRTDFSRAMLKRFHEIKGNLEDVWDLVANKAALEGRLRTLAAKEIHTENNLLDMALISCILWNDVDEDPE